MLQGFLFIIGNIVIASMQSVFLGQWLRSFNVYLVVGISFTIVMLLYVMISLAKGVNYISVIGGMKKNILFLNVVSAGNWMFYFLAIKYLNPASVVTITQCMPAVLTSLFMLLARKPLSKVTLFFHGMMLLCICLLLKGILYSPETQGSHAILGAAIALMCAVTVALTIGLSKSFSNQGLPSYAVLSLRFPLLIAISWCMAPVTLLKAITPGQIGIIVTIAIIGLALTNFLLQKGIELSNPLIVSTTLSTSPFVVLIFDKIYRHDYVINEQVYLITSIVIFSLLCVYADHRATQRRKVISPLTQ